MVTRQQLGVPLGEVSASKELAWQVSSFPAADLSLSSVHHQTVYSASGANEEKGK